MSALDEVMEEAACALDDELVSSARAELAALRQRVAEAEKPKTCESCKFYSYPYCNNEKTSCITLRWQHPDIFGCIHHEVAG